MGRWEYMQTLWDDESTKILTDGIAAGQSVSDLAAIINQQFNRDYSLKAVYRKLTRLGFKFKPAPFWPEAHKARFVELYHHEDGFSHGQIAAQLNAAFGSTYSRCACIGMARRLGFSGKKVRAKPVEKKPRVRKPRLKIVHGGLGSMRVIRTVEGTPPVQIVCTEIVPLNLTFAEIENGQCRFPYGEDSFVYCGHPQREDSSYCKVHHDLCLLPAKPPKEPGYVKGRAAA